MDEQQLLAFLSRGTNGAPYSPVDNSQVAGNTQIVNSESQPVNVNLVNSTQLQGNCAINPSTSTPVNASNLDGCQLNVIPFTFTNNSLETRLIVIGYFGIEGAFGLYNIGGTGSAADEPLVIDQNGNPNVKALQALNYQMNAKHVIFSGLDIISPTNDAAVLSVAPRRLMVDFDGTVKFSTAPNAIINTFVNGNRYSFFFMGGDANRSITYALAPGKTVEMNLYATALEVAGFAPYKSIC